MDARRRPRTDDELLGRLAARQAGLVARRQIAALGIGDGAIEHRLATGRLHRVRGHRGVFHVGHTARGPATAPWAAVLAAGPGAVISHRSAAALWGLLAAPDRVELTVPSGRRSRAALRTHRTRRLPPAHVTELDGLPCTTVARTLLDLGAVVPARRVEIAFDRADTIGVLDMRDVRRVLAEAARRPGSAALRAVAARDLPGSALTDSELGEMLLAIIRGAGLPEPRQQMPILGFRPDFCWPEARLIAEADGAAAHGTRRGHAHDTRRDVLLTNAGWTVLRFAYADIVGDPAYVADALGHALARGRRSP